MWLADRRIEDLNAIKVDRALADILASDPEAREAPTACPHAWATCSGRRSPERSLRQRVPASARCLVEPGRGERLRELLAAQDAALARKRDRLRVVRRTLVAALAVARGAVVAGAVVAGRDEVRRHRASPAEDPDSRRITPANWPQRDWSAWYPLPSASSQIGDRDELRYIQDVLLALQKAPTIASTCTRCFGRRAPRTSTNPAGRLSTAASRGTREAERARCSERLRAVHAIWSSPPIGKSCSSGCSSREDQGLDGRPLPHARPPGPDRLHPGAPRGVDRIRMLYPNLDHATSDAIESRLCRLM